MIASFSSVVTFGRNGCVTLTSIGIRAGGTKFKSPVLEGIFFEGGENDAGAYLNLIGGLYGLGFKKLPKPVY